ncbi:MAG: Ribosomal RNA-processing protein 7 [Candelina submexicana]|nr:MAG: Ribosomal RNA-processing protein 7 [Candelina submexicana]
MTKPTIPLEINDYLILPLALRPLAAFPTPATHYLYLRQHAPKIPTPDTARSLFVVNVPIDATELHFRYLFANHLGNTRVESVTFETKRDNAPKPAIAAPAAVPKGKVGKKRKRAEDRAVEEYSEASELPKTWDRDLHRSGSTAVVVFVDKASAETGFKAARKAAKEGTKIYWGDGVEGKVPALGSARYLTHQRLTYPSPSILLSSVNSYMTTYSNLEASRAAAATRARNEPDEEGFITVTRGGRTGPARQEEAQEEAEKQKQKKGLEDFYRFQSREKKKERAGELVRKFQEDREKVRRMKEGRGKFRPE